MTSNNLKIFLVAVLPGVLTVFIIFFLVMPQVREEREAAVNNKVTSFSECVAAGNPVMESYPRQCQAGKNVFVEDVEIELEELAGACPAEAFGQDCAIIEFLEEELAWTNMDSGKAFCAYTVLGQVVGDMYLEAFCEEYYVQDERVVCPDIESQQDCFQAKNLESSPCREKCEVEKVDKYLVTSSGIATPLKLSRVGDTYELWTPRDGSLYSSDLQAKFPKEIYKKIDDVDRGALESQIIDRAEEHFSTKASFQVLGEMDKGCSQYTDCGILPFEYAARSNCPHTVKCLEGRCVAGCYDFSDHSRFPLLGE